MRGFFKIFNDRVDSGVLFSLDHASLKVFLLLSRMFDRAKGYAYPSLEYITKEVRCARRTVVKAIRNLITRGLIARQAKGWKGQASRYAVPDLNHTHRADAQLELFGVPVGTPEPQFGVPRGHSIQTPEIQTNQQQHATTCGAPAWTGDNPTPSRGLAAAAVFHTDGPTGGDAGKRPRPMTPSPSAVRHPAHHVTQPSPTPLQALTEAQQDAITALDGFGIADEDARRLVARHDPAMVKAWAINIRQRKKQPTNPAGLLVAMLDGNKPLPRVIHEKSAAERGLDREKLAMERHHQQRLAAEAKAKAEAAEGSREEHRALCQSAKELLANASRQRHQVAGVATERPLSFSERIKAECGLPYSQEFTAKPPPQFVRTPSLLGAAPGGVR